MSPRGRRSHGFVVVASLVGGAAATGDYGLSIDDGLATSCKWEATHSNNVCGANLVIADLRDHHVGGKPLKLAAVRVGFAHCTVGFASDKERAAFGGAVAALLAEPTVVDERGLLHSVSCLPFAWMRRALDAQIAWGGHSRQTRARLQRARALTERRHGT